MKRFWKAVTADFSGDGWTIRLDDRPVRTPKRASLILPSDALTKAIAAEWETVGETIDPRAMPLTGIANAAIDHVSPDPTPFAASLAQFARSDLLCYRAAGPTPLVAREAATWDPLLAWAEQRFAVRFVVTTGIKPADQPPETIARLTQAVDALDPFTLAGLAPLVTVGGSLITALAVLERAVDVTAGWRAVSLDEDYQLVTWGEDAEARRALEVREADYRAGARFLRLLDA